MTWQVSNHAGWSAISASGSFETTFSQDRPAKLECLRQLSRALDHSFQLPGTRLQFGWDAIVGLVPIVGDVLGTCIGSYYIWHAYRHRASRSILLRMLSNIAVDTALGIVPVMGDVLDAIWQSNVKNCRLLQQVVESEQVRDVEFSAGEPGLTFWIVPLEGRERKTFC